MNDTNNHNSRLDPNRMNAPGNKPVPCGVIRDLLILYEDDVCSEDSCRVIKEHMESCEGCRKAYEQVTEVFPPVTGNPEDADKEEARFIKTLKKFRHKITLLNLLILGFFLLVAAALVKIGWTEFLESGIFSVPADDIRITELYQLSGGDIYCTMEFPKLINAPTLESMDIYDKTSDNPTGYYELHFQYPLSVNEEKYIYFDTISLIFPAKAGDFYSYSDPDVIYPCTSVYYRGKNKNDRLTIWEEGQKLEKAPEEIEQKAILAYQANGNLSKALDEIGAISKTLSKDEIIEHFTDYYKSQDSPDCFPIHACDE